ncbi:ribosomal RNA small subunit methyltransferase I [Salvia hispanica]|uniref:ribosomal RNA small subunit methyltransferase I n=1 Tax=Salvia hispanica TaxID=49212 RepID=UPI002009D6EC|nr:ribosomal RNA small subunit methyltransferase I [Salvia hispanica]XP_047961290.1 ribosomal RNA small subunit methyltransferase I [Salvia hispanica]
MKLLRLCHSMAAPFAIHLRRPAFPWHCPILLVPSNHFRLSASAHRQTITSALSFSTCNHQPSPSSDLADDFPSKQGPLKPGLYLVGTPIGNLEDITLRALKVLKSADVILSEDTRHSGKLLMYYKIKTPLLSYHKFNESQREQVVLKRLLGGEIVALISDAGMPGISDPGMELAKLCVDKNIPVIPVPGPSAVVAALSASGLPTNEFTFVGFLPKHATTRRERLMVSANSATTQVFFVPPHKLCQFLEESSSIFGNSRRCVIAREMTKLHEEFWRGTLGEANEAFSTHQPKGEITLMIEGMISEDDQLSNSQLENKLEELISKGHSLSTAVKVVASSTSMKRKAIYSLALEKYGNQCSEKKN